MLGGRLVFGLSIFLSTLTAGCLLDSGAYQSPGSGGSNSGPGGNGGATTTPAGGTGGAGGGVGAAGGTGGAGGGGMGGGGTGGGGAGAGGSTGASMGGAGGGTTTTTPTDCNSPNCDDGNPCTMDSCNAGTCQHTALPDGSMTSGQGDGDCKMTQCQGGTLKTVADPGDVPDKDPTDCVKTYCVGDTPTTDADNNGQLCGQQPANQCQKSVCDNKQCQTQNVPDGTVIKQGDGNDCRDLFCKSGSLSVFPDGSNCPGDPNSQDCIWWVCTAQGMCTNMIMAAPEGSPCKQGNGSSGQCNNNKQCCVKNGQVTVCL
jgi:hypothetical protein